MKIYKREKYLKKIRPFYHSDLIKVITGIRRCGKSCIMRLIMDELLAQGIPASQIIYIPLDKRGFKDIHTPQALEQKIESYLTATNNFSTTNTAHTTTTNYYYLFIDEVQNVTGFERVVQAFAEEENFSIFLTGSNSYLLSDEISTKLTGRYLSFEIYTLDFQEYLQMKQFKGLPVSQDLYSELEEYIVGGGFPKALDFPDKNARAFYTQSVVQEIFTKDIKKRKIIRNTQVFQAVQTYIINNYAATFSLQNIYEYFTHKEKIAITKTTLRNYINLLLKAKIVYRCDRFDQKSKRVLKGEYKFFIADMGLYFALNTDNRINYGASLENLTYLYLLSHQYSVSVGKIGKLECDFITRDTQNQYAYIQVTQSVADPHTEAREYRPFTYIRDGYPRYLLSIDRLRNQKDGVRHINIIDLFLGKAHI